MPEIWQVVFFTIHIKSRKDFMTSWKEAIPFAVNNLFTDAAVLILVNP